MEKRVLNTLEPQIVWKIFEDISQIPRESKKEEKIRSWVSLWAKRHAISYKEDKTGNLILSKNASKGFEHYQGITLQAHMDMVCQKTKDSNHNFDNDPIPLKIEGDYVTAEATTLGADNGVGMAMCLAALIDPNLNSGPVDVLLTVNEESGLTGARNLDSSFLNHNFLLNLDSETEGQITIASAGSGGTQIVLPSSRLENKSWFGFRLTISGLIGGHSGADIHKPRYNAIKVLTEGLMNIRQKTDFYISFITGGNIRNAVPREAYCDFVVDDKQSVFEIIDDWKSQIKTYRKKEPNIDVDLKEISLNSYMSSQITAKIIMLLYEIPHGPLSYSKDIPNLVETSNNLAFVNTTSDTIDIKMSTRSFVEEELERVRSEIKDLGERVNAKVLQEPAYQGWHSKSDSMFLRFIKQEYGYEYGQEVKLKAIHAGLETGLFKKLKPQLQLASIGPEIKDAHTPNERVKISSVELIWRVIKSIIANINRFEPS